MRLHDLKCWPEYFKLIISGDKDFELRKNDRDYQVNDICQLFEWDIETGLTGCKSDYFRIKYVLHKTPGLKDGYVVLLFDGPYYRKAHAMLQCSA